MSATGTISTPEIPASRTARSIISNRSPAVNGFSTVYDSSAVPIPISSGSSGRRARISRTKPRWPAWNGWKRPMRRPRTGAAISLGAQILHVVQELLDVGTARGEVVPAMLAVAVVPRRQQAVVELVARAVEESMLLVDRFGKSGGSRGGDRMGREPERTLHDPMGRPGGAGGVPRTGASSPDRLVAWTIAARRPRRDSLRAPCPTRAYLRTSRSVRTGITSTIP